MQPIVIHKTQGRCSQLAGPFGCRIFKVNSCFGFMSLSWLGKKCCTCCSRHIYPHFVYKLSVWLASLPLNDHVFRCGHVVMLNIKVPKPQHSLLVLVKIVAKPTLKVTMLSSIVRLFLTLIYYMDS
jgi:hypothetical protein